MSQQRRGLIALRSLLHHCPLHFSPFSHLFRILLAFFRGHVSHKGQPVVGDGDAVTGDKDVRIVRGLSLLPCNKEKGFLQDTSANLICAA